MRTPKDSGKARVFISHTDRVPEDKAFTDELIQRFKKAGIPYWVDREHPIRLKNSSATGPAPGNPLFRHLCKAIAGCDVLVFIVSRTSVGRQFVRLEFDPRVLFGPAGHIMKARTGLMALLGNPETPEIVIVLGSLCGNRSIINLEDRSFDHFWRRFRRVYKRAKVLPKDDSWKKLQNFQAQPRPRKLTTPQKRQAAQQGHLLFQQALDRVAKGELDLAEELLADAYQAFLQADEFLAMAQVLYETFKVGLQIGMNILRQKRRILKIGSFVARDTRRVGLECIASALRSLTGSIEYSAKAGNQSMSFAMVKLMEETERQLKDAGLGDVRERVATMQREQVQSIMRILAGPPDQ